jgi:hypothetical protein
MKKTLLCFVISISCLAPSSLADNYYHNDCTSKTFIVGSGYSGSGNATGVVGGQHVSGDAFLSGLANARNPGMSTNGCP